MAGYFKRRPIAGSDGSRLAVLGSGYFKDAKTVFYSRDLHDDVALRDKTSLVTSASAESFVVKEQGCAMVQRQVAVRGVLVTREVSNFQVLDSFYAKTKASIFF